MKRILIALVLVALIAPALVAQPLKPGMTKETVLKGPVTFSSLGTFSAGLNVVGDLKDDGVNVGAGLTSGSTALTNTTNHIASTSGVHGFSGNLNAGIATGAAAYAHLASTTNIHGITNSLNIMGFGVGVATLSSGATFTTYVNSGLTPTSYVFATFQGQAATAPMGMYVQRNSGSCTVYLMASDTLPTADTQVGILFTK